MDKARCRQDGKASADRIPVDALVLVDFVVADVHIVRVIAATVGLWCKTPGLFVRAVISQPGSV